MVVAVMTVVPMVIVVVDIMFLGHCTKGLAVFPDHSRVKG
jgi:hypothetical protein